MGGVGGPELLVILVVALLVFGPKSIPGIARGVGKGMRELRRLNTEFQREINLAAGDDDSRPVPKRRPAESAPSAPSAPADAPTPASTAPAAPTSQEPDKGGNRADGG